MKKLKGMYLYHTSSYRWFFALIGMATLLFVVLKVMAGNRLENIWTPAEARSWLLYFLAPILCTIQILSLRANQELFFALPMERKTLYRYQLYLFFGITFLLSLVCYFCAFLLYGKLWIEDFLFVNLSTAFFLSLVQSMKPLKTLLIKQKIFYTVIASDLLFSCIFSFFQNFYLWSKSVKGALLIFLFAANLFLIYGKLKAFDQESLLHPTVKEKVNQTKKTSSLQGEWGLYIHTLIAFLKKSSLFLVIFFFGSIVVPFTSMARIKPSADHMSLIILTCIMATFFSSNAYILKVPYKIYQLPFTLPTDRKKAVIINYVLELSVFFLYVAYLFLFVQRYHFSWSDASRGFAVYGFTRIVQLFIEWILLLNSSTTTFEGRYFFVVLFSVPLATISFLANFNAFITMGFYLICTVALFFYSIKKVYTMDFI